MKCLTCGNDNPTDAQFCGGCGVSLSISTSSGIGIGTAELPMVSFPQAINLGFKNYFKFNRRVLNYLEMMSLTYDSVKS